MIFTPDGKWILVRGDFEGAHISMRSRWQGPCRSNNKLHQQPATS